jgi:hypothetical protein
MAWHGSLLAYTRERDGSLLEAMLPQRSDGGRPHQKKGVGVVHRCHQDVAGSIVDWLLRKKVTGLVLHKGSVIGWFVVDWVVTKTRWWCWMLVGMVKSVVAWVCRRLGLSSLGSVVYGADGGIVCAKKKRKKNRLACGIGGCDKGLRQADRAEGEVDSGCGGCNKEF